MTTLTNTKDGRFQAEPIGMHHGVNSYRLTMCGIPLSWVRRGEPPCIIPASRTPNALAQAPDDWHHAVIFIATKERLLRQLLLARVVTEITR